MKTTQPERRLLHLREVAALLRLPLRTVLAAALVGQLPLGRHGRRLGIDATELYAQFGSTRS